MSYIITAAIDVDLTENREGSLDRVLSDPRLNVRFLMRVGTTVTLDTPGDFSRGAGIVSLLCQVLVSAGFYSFTLGHSY